MVLQKDAWTKAFLLSDLLLNEGDSLPAQFLGVAEDGSPDAGGGSQVRKELTERFDREPTVILDVLEAAEIVIPGNAATGAGNAAIVFRDMDVDAIGSEQIDRFAHVGFFDVAVKRVDHRLDVGMMNVFEELLCLGGGIDEILFESIQKFERDHHPDGLSIVSGGPEEFDRSGVLHLRRALAGEEAKSLGERAAHDGAAERFGAIEILFDGVEGGLAFGRIVRDRVGTLAEDRDGGAPRPAFLLNWPIFWAVSRLQLMRGHSSPS